MFLVCFYASKVSEFYAEVLSHLLHLRMGMGDRSVADYQSNWPSLGPGLSASVQLSP